ncbi:MAG: acetyltransferase [Saprospiraceae bacterium]|nr:acetyltransferase [Saprospiraceae bacterium]
MKQYLVIIGAGGHSKDLMTIIDDLNLRDNVIAFAEDNDFYRKRTFFNKPVITFSELDPMQHSLILAVGDPFARHRIYTKLGDRFTYPSMIHPSVRIRDTSNIGNGALIFEGVIISHFTKIGNHSHINTRSIVTHDTIIDDFSSIAPCAMLGGGCHIGKRTYLGAGVIVRDKITICENTLIGMGSLVTKSISTPGLYYGSPCKKVGDLDTSKSIFN